MRGCRHARSRILREVDQDLELQERFRLDAHLERCANCRAWRARALALEELVAALPEPQGERLDVEQGLVAIRRAIDAGVEAPVRSGREPGTGSLPRSGRRRWGSAASAAALLGAAALLLTMLRKGDEENEPASREAPPELASASSARSTFASGLPVAPVVSVPTSEDATPAPRAHEAVQRELRARLVAGLGTLEDDEELPAGDATIGQGLERWPLERMAEGLLADPDPTVARAAARFLGGRGDRISVSRLGAVLGRADVAPAALRALGDLGSISVGPLSSALDDPATRTGALAQLVRVGGGEAAQAIECALERALEAAPRGPRLGVLEEHLRALVGLGAPAVASLLHLESSGTLERAEVLPWLERVDGAAEELRVRIAASGTPPLATPGDVDFLLEAAARLTPEATLPWVLERAGEHRHRGRALACLAAWSGTAPLASLLELDVRGSVPEEDLVRTFRTLADRQPERVAELARLLLESGDALSLQRYLELLVTSEHRAAARALVLVARAELLPMDERQWAALAVGEFGDEHDARALATGLGHHTAGERRLFAACLISIHRLLGEDGVLPVLQGFSQHGQRRVFEALPARALEPTSHETRARDTGAVALFRVARALDDSLPFRSPSLSN